MKILFLFLALLITGCNETLITPTTNIEEKTPVIKALDDTAMVRTRNFSITNGKLSFDIDCKMVSPEPFKMGSTTFVLNKTNLVNPILSNVNPKYTIGGENGYYQMFLGDYGEQIALQIIYLNPPGSIVSNEFERIATVTMLVTNADFTLNWNQIYTMFINPEYKKAKVLLAESTKIK